jgi:hypothetical protein
VKFETKTRRTAVLVSLVILAAHSIGSAADKKEKEQVKSGAPQTIDSGSFGIFVNKQRVATEIFSVQQEASASSIKSQVKESSGEGPAIQKSDLEITRGGELIRYDWSQASGGSLSVFPDNEFLKERIVSSATAKPAEQAFLLPSVTPILDNNFFIHRELLAWKYLNAVCQASGNDTKCRQEPADFGTLIPQDRMSMSIRLEIVGKEKVTIRGAERELLRLNLRGEQLDWALWVDENDHFKLVRVAIPADNTEVVRD